MANEKDRSGWAIGGGILMGLGVGLFVLKLSALAFVGAILSGLGLGLIIAAVLSRDSGADR